MRTHPLALFALAVHAVLAGGLPARAADQEWRDCEQSANWDRKIAGCTAVLARGSAETPQGRARALTLRSQAHLNLKNFDKAIADASEALLFDPKNAVALNNRGLAYNDTGQYDRAIRDLNEAIRFGSEDFIVLYNRGLAYLNKGEHDRAIKDYDKAIRLNPKSATAFNNRGYAYLGKGEHDQAIKDFDEALRLDPQHAITFANRGLAYVGKGEYDRAIRDYDEALRLNPKAAVTFNNRGFAYFNKGEHDRAIRDYDAAIRLEPKAATAFANRGDAYAGKGEHDRAIRDYDEAIRLEPKLGGAYRRRGDVRRRNGALDEAIADYDAAIRLDPKNHLALSGRGDAYAVKGDHRKALADYEAALALDGSLASALEGRKQALAALERMKPPAEAPQPTPQVAALDRAPPAETPQPPVAVKAPLAGKTLSGRRYALVIGIDDYWILEDLRAARNDARAVGAALKELGFEVLEGADLDHAAMSGKLAELAQRIEPGDSVFFFFAGHGFAAGESNYLLPADMPMVEKGQEGLFKFKAFAADQIVDLLQTRGARTAILVLDACRNNPFERPGSRAPLPGSRGLRLVEPPEGVFVLYSAASRQVALDRLNAEDTHPNSVFTRVFVEELRRPGAAFTEIADRTRRAVYALARGVGKDQRPAFYNEIVEPFVLK